MVSSKLGYGGVVLRQGKIKENRWDNQEGGLHTGRFKCCPGGDVHYIV